MTTGGGYMFSLFHCNRINPITLAEEMGYECGWMGLDNNNPYKPQSPEWVAYNWGYNQALMDAEELYIYPTEETWP
jgi:hypothetical protein